MSLVNVGEVTKTKTFPGTVVALKQRDLIEFSVHLITLGTSSANDGPSLFTHSLPNSN